MSKIGIVAQFTKGTWVSSVADFKPQTGFYPAEENRLASRFILTVTRGNGKPFPRQVSGKAARSESMVDIDE